jgi:RHS repeat-associated protein
MLICPRIEVGEMWDKGPMARLALAALAAAVLASPTPVSAQHTTGLRYDALRRLVGEIAPDPDSGGPLRHPAIRYSWRPDGLLERIEKGVLAGWQAETVAPSGWTGFDVQARTDFAYDAVGNRIEEREFGTAGTLTGVTQFGYDADGRLVCTAVRMNLVSPPAAGTDACLPVDAGAATPDRITKNVYDAAGQLLQVRRGVGLPAYEQAEVTYSYTPNGKREHLIDANGNRARFAYDSFDRRSHWYLPSPTMPTAWNPATPATALATAGAASTTDFEFYGYDANDNRTSLQKRGHRAGVSDQILNFGYDALNRIVLKDLPGGTASDVHYAYDLRGLQTQARFGSLSGLGVSHLWDKARRLASTTDSSNGTSRTLGYGYDPASNRTQITHPGTANYFTYEHDPLNRVTVIREKGAAAIATFLYDDEGRRDALARPGATTSYDYDPASRLQALGHVFTQSASNVTMSHTYNAADQMLSRTITNNAYVYSEPANASAVYARNGLNQYTSVGTAQLTWDNNGNLASDGSTGFTYDLENRLTGASGAKTATLRYDPLGRLRETSGGAFGTVRYLYDGDALVAEYDTAGTLLRRYVHGPGIDEPLLWYEGATVAASTRRNLHANHQGSIVAATSDSGSTFGLNAYDAWGLPEPGNLGRFQYTGQILLYELGLYHYKARTYSPALGRFLQTDPVAYDDQFNLYAYVSNDPLDGTDPFGDRGYFAARPVAPRTLFSIGGINVRLTPGTSRLKFGHGFIAVGARFVGDPRARIISFGNRDGILDNISNVRGNLSEGKSTNELDRTAWLSMSASSRNVAEIGAPDDVIDQTVARVQPTEYSVFGPNSTSAALAAANEAQQQASGDPTSKVGLKNFDLRLTGAEDADEITFGGGSPHTVCPAPQETPCQ